MEPLVLLEVRVIRDDRGESGVAKSELHLVHFRVHHRLSDVAAPKPTQVSCVHGAGLNADPPPSKPLLQAVGVAEVHGVVGGQVNEVAPALVSKESKNDLVLLDLRIILNAVLAKGHAPTWGATLDLIRPCSAGAGPWINQKEAYQGKKSRTLGCKGSHSRMKKKAERGLRRGTGRSRDVTNN